MEIFILWILASWVVAVVAEARGRIGWGWLVVAMVITPLFAILVLMALPRRVGGKTCPDCAETVKEAARICRHCGHDFRADLLDDAA